MSLAEPRPQPPLSSSGKRAWCTYCERALVRNDKYGLAPTRDHVYPKCLGGRRRVWACEACNNIKGDMIPEAWKLFRINNPGWWKLWRRQSRRHRSIGIGEIISGDSVRDLARKIIREDA